MADFKPLDGTLFGENTDGDQFMILGWWSQDDWLYAEPVVANPDGPGIAPWHVYFGDDPWKIAGRKID